mmetsp:Transcript_23526/g.28982  ORF Transcript_23526/g.28982 Transcript_23526/m.28982 type:complete len:159 (+) Transcript_23526:264-740(+)
MIIDYGFKLIKFGSLVYVVKSYVFDVTMCIGPSMLPTFNCAGDIVVVEHITPRFGTLKVGHVVLANSPTNPKKTICKRIKGFGGDVVKPSKLYPSQHVAEKRIPKGRVWLEGDNPSNSTDSRNYGPVPEALIKGRVLFKIWPLHEMRYIGRDFTPSRI